MRSSIIPSFLYFALYFSAALSFSVTVGSDTTTQCGSLDVAWTGGQAPFEIHLVPAFNIPRNISVPSTAFQNNQGSYQISPIPFVNGSRLLVVMSDATGFGTGGTSELITVGTPAAGASCNTTDPSLFFSFGLPSSLKQCGPYVFDDYEGAVLPVTITGFIPGGDIFFLQPPLTEVNFTWTADVAAGTTVIFSMTDAQGHSGGTSDASVVALSNDANCLDNSPTSTLSAVPSASTTSSSTSSPTQKSGASKGTVIGAAVGAVLAIAAIVTLAACYLKRQRFGRSSFRLASKRNLFRPNSVELDPDADNFQHPPIYPFPYQTDSVSHLAPPIMPGSPSSPASYQETSSAAPSVRASDLPYTYQHSRASSNAESFAALGDVASSSMSSSARRKAAMARTTSYRPTRFVVHTDAEDHNPDDEVEVVELPPQYSDRGAPAVRVAEERPSPSAVALSSTDLAYLSGQHVGEQPQSDPHPPPE